MPFSESSDIWAPAKMPWWMDIVASICTIQCQNPSGLDLLQVFCVITLYRSIPLLIYQLRSVGIELVWASSSNENSPSFPVLHTQIHIQIRENLILHPFGDYLEWMEKRAILKVWGERSRHINRGWRRTRVKLSHSAQCCDHNELTVSSQLVRLSCVKVLH